MMIIYSMTRRYRRIGVLPRLSDGRANYASSDGLGCVKFVLGTSGAAGRGAQVKPSLMQEPWLWGGVCGLRVAIRD
jgi:hypothetical protein